MSRVLIDSKPQVYSVHLHNHQQCYSPRWLCWRRRMWRAWCPAPCGWTRLYEGKNAAQVWLDCHREACHGGRDEHPEQQLGPPCCPDCDHWVVTHYTGTEVKTGCAFPGCGCPRTSVGLEGV